MKKIISMAALGFICALGCSGTEKPINYQSAFYNTDLYQKWVKDTGIKQLKIGNTLIFPNNFVYANPVNGQIREQASAEYQAVAEPDGITMITVKKISCPKEKTEYAEVSRKYVFSSNKIKVDIAIKIQKEITFKYHWNGFRELLALHTASVAGANIEALGTDGQTKILGLVPKVFKKEEWQMKSTYNEVKFITNDFTIRLKGSENTQIGITHYGGQNIELNIIAPSKEYQKIFKPGDMIQWSYTILIEKNS